MGIKEDNFTNFDNQEEVEVTGKPQIKLFKKGDTFIGFLKSISNNPLEVGVDNGLGGLNFGNKVFTFQAIGDKQIDHKSSDGTATGDAIPNEIIAGSDYNFFTNYIKKNFLNVNGSKLSVLPLGAIVKIENLGKKKSEKSSFSYKDISIIGKKGADGQYIIHPDYKPLNDFSGQEEISVEDIPF